MTADLHMGFVSARAQASGDTLLETNAARLDPPQKESSGFSPPRTILTHVEVYEECYAFGHQAEDLRRLPQTTGTGVLQVTCNIITQTKKNVTICLIEHEVVLV